MRPLVVIVPVVLALSGSFLYATTPDTDTETEQPSICESTDVIMYGLPKAVSEKFHSVGNNIKTSDIEIMNIAESHALADPNSTLCHAGLRFNRGKKEERYLIDYLITGEEDHLSVVVNKINEL